MGQEGLAGIRVSTSSAVSEIKLLIVGRVLLIEGTLSKSVFAYCTLVIGIDRPV